MDNLRILCDLYISSTATRIEYVNSEKIDNLKKNILEGINSNRLDKVILQAIAKFGNTEILLDLYKIANNINKLEIELLIKTNDIHLDEKFHNSYNDMLLRVINDKFYTGQSEIDSILPKVEIDKVIELPDEIYNLTLNSLQYGRFLNVIQVYKNLELISIDGMNDSYFADRIENVIKNLPNINKLYISNYLITDNNMKDLCISLCRYTNMYQFGFSGILFTPYSCRILLCALVKMKNLTVLNLSGNKMGVRSAFILAKGLKQLCHLREFDISDNDLNVSGTKVIVSGLKNLKDLVCVRFDNNNITDKGLSLVLNILKNEEVYCLSFINNMISDVGCNMLIKYVNKMKRILLLDISNNIITQEGLLSLIEKAAQYPHLVVKYKNSELMFMEIDSLGEISTDNPTTIVNPNIEEYSNLQLLRFILSENNSNDIFSQLNYFDLINITEKNIYFMMKLYKYFSRGCLGGYLFEKIIEVLISLNNSLLNKYVLNINAKYSKRSYISFTIYDHLRDLINDHSQLHYVCFSHYTPDLDFIVDEKGYQITIGCEHTVSPESLIFLHNLKCYKFNKLDQLILNELDFGKNVDFDYSVITAGQPVKIVEREMVAYNKFPDFMKKLIPTNLSYDIRNRLMKKVKVEYKTIVITRNDLKKIYKEIKNN